ncbi:aromatic ring-hydroxylating oxygenase subunit alpha [Roseovarius albus]|nr:aromatic ring-hydroxylating dioxygenase subunit alpha [Roseovarius albus]
MPLSDLLEAVRKNAALPEDQSEATPPQVYTSQEFLELERTRIFNHEWICVGRSDEFQNPGDYRVTTISSDDVVVLRDHDGELRAMSNICRHRMMSLLEGEGTLRGKITCPYHAWTYNLDGQLIGAVHMRDNFDKSTCRLPQFAVEEWLGWVYVNLDPDAEPLAPRLAPLAKLLANYNVASYRTLFRVDEVWDTNWKILFQNFMEPYHLFAVHKDTVEKVLPTQHAHVITGGPGYCLYTQGRNPGVAFEYSEAMSNPNPDLSEDEVNCVPLFGAFPAQMASVSAERTFWMSLMPIETNKVRVFWGVDVHPDAMPDGSEFDARVAELKASFHAINGEDKPVTAAIARNAAALSAQPGRLSPKEQTIWEFQRYLARLLTTGSEAKTFVRKV